MAPRNGKRQREDLWERALARAKLGVWDWNLVTGECFYSATWAEMLGYRPEELPNTSDLWISLTHPDDREAAIASGDRHLAGLSENIETELRLRHKDGHWVWVLDRGGVVERDSSGKPLRAIGVQTDISRQKATELQMEQVNARSRIALAASGIGIWHHNLETDQSFWDERTRQVYGLDSTSSEIGGDLWQTYVHPEDLEEAVRAHLAPIGTQDVVAIRYRILRRGGEVRYVESLVRFIPEVGPAGQLLGTVRDITDETLREQELAHAARHDPLTDALNRSAFDAHLSRAIKSIRELPVALFYIDLDFFKALNDLAGHAAGDQALQRIADRIRSVLPPNAQLSRLGGDEFALMVPEFAIPDAERLAEEILAAIRGAGTNAKGTRRLTASIGLSFVQDSRTTVADALACADDACYTAKAGGRDKIAVFSQNSTLAVMSLNSARLASDTLDALNDGRMRLFGQQIQPLSMHPHQWSWIEVLARLTSKTGEEIPPSEFIPAAERFGVAAQLDRWAIKTALTRFGRFAAEETGLHFAFNLSAQTLSDPTLWDFVDSVISSTGASHSNITFEVTETAAVTNFEAAESFVHHARMRRCGVSLDDFGAGMSSFEYLRRFPIDNIKINGSFVANVASTKFDRDIVSAINGIAKNLGCSVIAEMIEDEETVKVLNEMGVEYGQGFYLHRPEPLEDIIMRVGSQNFDERNASVDLS
jgi:diguanylate cyclase (GGDEF)-like protein/PAS domain S-box-containing protein